MKNNHNRLKFVLTSTMITGMVALLIWAFSSVNSMEAGSGALDRVQAENNQLRQTVAEMRSRETIFRTQIQKANETIFQLIDQPEPTAPALSSLQQQNAALQEQISILEQQLQQLQTPSQSSLSFRSNSEESEHEESEHDGG